MKREIPEVPDVPPVHDVPPVREVPPVRDVPPIPEVPEAGPMEECILELMSVFGELICKVGEKIISVFKSKK